MAEQARRIDETTREPAAPVPALVAVPPLPVEERPSEPPDPESAARALGLCVAEVLTGSREVDSIARWITDDVHRHLQHRAAVAAHARSIARRSRARPALHVGSVVLCRPAPGVVEASVVVHTRSHARAVAIRLEDWHGRWRATAIGVL